MLLFLKNQKDYVLILLHKNIYFTLLNKGNRKTFSLFLQKNYSDDY